MQRAATCHALCRIQEVTSFETARTGPCCLLMQLPCPPGHLQQLYCWSHLTSSFVLQMAKEDDSALHSWLRWLDRLLVHLLFNVVW